MVDYLIEEKNLLLLDEVITAFEDIPEAYLIKVIQFYLSCDDSSFEGLFKYPDMQTEVKNEEEGKFFLSFWNEFTLSLSPECPLNIQPIVVVRGLKRQLAAASTNFVGCFLLALFYFFFPSFFCLR